MRSLLAAMVLLAGCATTPPAADRTAYINGFVFDGKSFVARPLVVERGRFVDAAPASAATIVDLAGKHVTPPFCEAHNHNLGFDYQHDKTVADYLRAGIFYVKILSNTPGALAEVRDRFGGPKSVDARFAMLPLTGVGGHPWRLHARLNERGAYPGFTRETLVGGSHYQLADRAALAEAWPKLMAMRPDFVKVVLVKSENFAARLADPALEGVRGIDPALVPEIVRLARRAELRVSAHVDTAADFGVAVRAGVGEIAHLPGYSEPQTLLPADIAEAARRKVTVVTTATLADRRKTQADHAQVVAGQRANLSALAPAGVPIALGSDDTQTPAAVLAEADYIRDLGALTPSQLLTALTAACARTFAADRHIDGLEPGDEASFLVLDGDPLADWSAVRRISRRVKQGVEVRLPGS